MDNATNSPALFQAGVDWITLSGMGGVTSEELAWRSDRLLEEEYLAGNNKRPWGMAGFNGWKCGHVQYGFRGKEVIVRLGAEVAAENWRQLYALSDNCSRIDCQVTINNGIAPAVVIRRAYQRARAWARTQPKGGGVSILETTNGPSTIYFNRRVSDRFGRIYDKGAQSKLEAFRGAVRWEIEFKNRAARVISTTLAGMPEDLELCVYEVNHFMSKRSASWGTGPRSSGSDIMRPTYLSAGSSRLSQASVSDCQRRLLWIQTTVSRTVNDLIDRGFGTETLIALGLVPNSPVC